MGRIRYVATRAQDPVNASRQVLRIARLSIVPKFKYYVQIFLPLAEHEFFYTFTSLPSSMYKSQYKSSYSHLCLSKFKNRRLSKHKNASNVL